MAELVNATVPKTNFIKVQSFKKSKLKIQVYKALTILKVKFINLKVPSNPTTKFSSGDITPFRFKVGCAPPFLF